MGDGSESPFRPWLLRYWAGLCVQRIRSRGRVAGGVFAGMAYIHRSVGSQLVPKWLGTYECELKPILTSLLKTDFRHIIDVGAAEGYYAVGAALKWPFARITAFESTEVGRSSIAELAKNNSVTQRIGIRGHCDMNMLSGTVPHEAGCLILMDVEGAEHALLEPVSIPALGGCHIIVELHEWLHEDLDSILRARFAATHEIVETWTRVRTLEDFEEPRSAILRRLFRRSLIAAVDEWRPGPMRWLYMSPKAQAASMLP